MDHLTLDLVRRSPIPEASGPPPGNPERMLRYFSVDNPVTVLLTVTRARRGGDLAAPGAALAALVGGRLALDHSLGAGVFFAALVFGLVYPMLRAGADATLVGDLRLGRGMEEVLGTRMSAQELVDGVAGYSLRRSLVPAALVTLALFLVSATGSAGLAMASLLTFPSVLLMVALVSYFCQVQAAAASPVPFQADSLFFLALAVALLILGGLASSLLAVLVPLPLLAALRTTAADAVEDGTQPPPPPEPRPARLPRTVRLWSDNPIVVRELQREARRLPASRVDAWVASYGGTALSCAVLVAVAWGLDAGVAAVAFGLLMVVQVLRAAHDASGAMADERLQGTLETLALTGLTPKEFVDGWASLALRPRAVDHLLLLPLVWSGGPLAFLWAVTVPMLPAAAYVSLWGTSGAQSRSRAQSLALVGGITLVFTAFIAYAFGILVGAVGTHDLGLDTPVPAFTGAAAIALQGLSVAVLFRSLVLRRLGGGAS